MRNLGFKPRVILIAAALTASWLALQVGAAPVTFRFSMTVDVTKLGGAPETPLIVTYTFDSELPQDTGGWAGIPDQFTSYGPLTAIDIQLGDQLASASTGSILISVASGGDIFTPPGSAYDVRTENFPDELIEGQLLGRNVEFFRFTLADNTAPTMLHDLALPLSPEFALAADQLYLDLSFTDGTGISLVGTPPFTLTQVPEPSTFVLAAVGTAGAVLLVRKRRHGKPAGRAAFPRRLRLPFLGMTVMFISTSPLAVADIAYTITDLGTLGGTQSVAAAINDLGQIVGNSYTAGDAAYRMFLYDGTMHDLGIVGTKGSYMGSINNSGAYVGSFESNQGYRAFLHDGTLHNIGTFPGGAGSGAGDINDAGQVVGYSGLTYNFGDYAWHAFLYDGALHDIGTLGGTWSEAYGINNLGQVTGEAFTTGNTGSHAFFYDGTMHDLGTLGGTTSVGSDLNDAGQVAGSSTLPGEAIWHAFLYDGTMHDLGTLGGPSSFAYDINEAGVVVGTSHIDDITTHAFVYREGVMRDLNSLIDPAAGWELTWASSINASGQIVGYGLINDQTHAFLLTPVPEPGALLLAALGMVGLVALRTRRGSARA